MAEHWIGKHMDTEDRYRKAQGNLWPEWEAEKLRETRKRVLIGFLFFLALILSIGVAFAEPYVAGRQVNDKMMNICTNEQAAQHVVKMHKQYGFMQARQAFTEYALFGICTSLEGDFIPMKVTSQVGMGHPLHGVWWVYIIKIHSPYNDDIAYLITERELVGEVDEIILGTDV